MVKKELLARKLAALEENIQILEGLRKYPFEIFIAEPEKYGSTERFLQLSIEILDDIGSHIVADENLGVVGSYAEIARLLLQKKYITQEQSEFWITMVGFRNILVHAYTKIDRSIVYRVLQDNIKDLKSLASQFAKLL